MSEPSEPTGQRRRAGTVVWCWAVLAWSIVFAVPHLYWALGGRAGLGSEAAAADRALAQSWFAGYNLLVAMLAIAAAVLAAVVGIRRGSGGVSRRWARRLSIVVGLGGVVLLLRGGVGVTLLVVGALTGSSDEAVPPLLLAIEPWFVLGGVVYLGMAIAMRRETRRAGEAVR